MTINIFLFIAVFLAYFIKSLVGFGNALILNSLFSYFIQTKYTTAIDLLLVFPINIYMVWRERKGLRLKITFPMLLSTLIGSTLGIILLNFSKDKTLKVILGLVIIAVSLQLSFNSKKVKPRNSIIEFIKGIGSGLLLGLYGIAALLAVQMQHAFADKEKYRSNLCLILVIDNIYRIFGYTSNGIINKTILLYSCYMLPLVLLAVFCASLIDKKINTELIKKIVIALLLISGLTIFITNIIL